MVKRLLTLDEAAEWGGYSVRTLRAWIASGDLRAFRPKEGRSLRIAVEDLEAFFYSSERAANGDVRLVSLAEVSAEGVVA